MKASGGAKASRRAKSTGSAKRRRAKPGLDDGARVLHLDTFSGIAGNMFLGAMLDAGLPRKELEAQLAGLGVDHRLIVKRVTRGALAARYVDVAVPKPRGAAGKGKPAHHHGHDHGHSHGHAHGRRYKEIATLIGGADLVAPVRDRALAIFEALAAAEAHVHGISIDEVHFHEVGAVDAMVDVTGAAIALEVMEIARVTASPVAIGHGHVDCDHGRLPLPAPATLELLKGIPTVPAHVAWETVTPTGAAILRTIADDFGPLPEMVPEAVGIGAGNDRSGPMPNVLRAVIGRAQGVGRDRVCVIETNLDDLVPEHFDHLMERLFEAGALDVGLQHLQMKKNRPGFLVRVIARPADRTAIAEQLFAESSAIGVRTSEWDRVVLEREHATVTTPYGRIAVKRVRSPGGTWRVTAEYDACKRAAREHGAALRDVVRAAEKAEG